MKLIAAIFDWIASYWSVEARCRRATRDAERAIDRLVRMHVRR